MRVYNNYVKVYLQKVLSQRRYIYSEESQDNIKFGTENFISNHWPIKNNKQIQCVIPALTPLFNRKISVKTSTSDFQQEGVQLYRMKTSNSYRKIIIPKRMKMNMQVQRSCLNCVQNGSSALDNCTDEKMRKKQISRLKEKRLQGKEIPAIFVPLR